MTAREVPQPAVSPQAYDAEYFLHDCMGSGEWEASGGRDVAELYRGILDLAGFVPGTVVVDVGCGRGELVAVAARDGAARAIGVDYAPAAIELAQQTLRVHEVDDRAEVHLVDARTSPVGGGVADLVTMVDVVEHLTPAELHRTLVEARRMLRPGGKVFAHTMPNRTIYQVTYRALRAAARLKGLTWPSEPRNARELQMHVNEQTVGSLARALRAAGFRHVHVELGRWVYTDHLPDGRGSGVVRRLAATPGLRRLGIADMFATGTTPC